MRIPTFYQFQVNASSMAKQFDQMNRLYAQSVSGKKIQASSEDPVLASQIKSNENYVSELKNYFNNGVLADNRSKLFNTTILNVVNTTGDIQTLIKKAQGGTLSDRDRASLAQQLQGDLSRLVTLANSKDAGGNYVFSGFNTSTAPYVQQNGSYTYQGSLSHTTIDIGPNANALFYENGFKVFGDIFNGNGRFTVTADETNTGNASSTPGVVADPSAYVQDTYTLTFVTNSNGQLAYQVVGASSGQVVPPLPATIPDDAPAYTAKADISFNGLSINVNGAPAVGDVFTIAPSTQQNVFNTVQELAALLEQPITNQALFDQKLSQLSATMAQISQHLIEYQSQVGTQSGSIERQIKINDDAILNYTTALSGLQDVDPVQVYSALAQKSLALQATQQSYAKLQETLLQLLRL